MYNITRLLVSSYHSVLSTSFTIFLIHCIAFQLDISEKCHYFALRIYFSIYYIFVILHDLVLHFDYARYVFVNGVVCSFVLLVDCIFLEYLEETYYFAFITCFIVLHFKQIGCLRYVWERIIIFFSTVIVHFTVLNFYCNIYISRRTLVRTLSFLSYFQFIVLRFSQTSPRNLLLQLKSMYYHNKSCVELKFLLYCICFR